MVFPHDDARIEARGGAAALRVPRPRRGGTGAVLGGKGVFSLHSAARRGVNPHSARSGGSEGGRGVLAACRGAAGRRAACRRGFGWKGVFWLRSAGLIHTGAVTATAGPPSRHLGADSGPNCGAGEGKGGKGAESRQSGYLGREVSGNAFVCKCLKHRKRVVRNAHRATRATRGSAARAEAATEGQRQDLSKPPRPLLPSKAALLGTKGGGRGRGGGRISSRKRKDNISSHKGDF